MNGLLPHSRDAQMLHRLRTLRVQRARERCGVAQAGVVGAQQAVEARMGQIDASRRELDALSHAVVHTLAPQLPRWSGVAAAQRERIADRLERDEYALVGDEQKLEEARETLQQARAELTLALAREGAVRDVVTLTRRAEGRARERRGEIELEDLGQPRRGQRQAS